MARRGLRKADKYIKHHRKNADAPYIAGGATIGIFAIISIVIFGASWIQSTLISTNNFAAVVAAVLIDLTNTDRELAGVESLTTNEQLTVAAQAKANDMAEKGYFAHQSPDGRMPWGFIRAAGYDYKNAGENLAIQFSDSEEVERAWLASPTHRANILDGRFTEIGIATAYGTYQGQPTTYVVQMFGAPRAVLNEPEPAQAVLHAVLEAPDVSESAVLGVASALTDEPPKENGEHVSVLWRVAASPETYFEYAMAALAALVLSLGAYAWWYEMRQRHFRHSAYAVLLSLALVAFLYAVDAFVFTNPIIADSLIITTS